MHALSSLQMRHLAIGGSQAAQSALLCAEQIVCSRCSSLAAAMGNADAVISAIGGSGDANTYHAVDNEVLTHTQKLPLTMLSFRGVSVSSTEALSNPVSLASLRHQCTHSWRNCIERVECDLCRGTWLLWMQRSRRTSASLCS